MPSLHNIHNCDRLAHEVIHHRCGEDDEANAAYEQHERYSFLHRARLSLAESYV